jgi:hypothetical protein
MVDEVRQNLEKANERVYGKDKVLRFHDVLSEAEVSLARKRAIYLALELD